MTTHFPITRVILYTLAVLAILALAWTLIQIRSIIIVLIIGIVFAGAIEPLVFRLRQSGITRAQAILVVYAVILTIVFGSLYLMVPFLVRQFGALDTAIPDMFENLREQALASDHAFVRQTGNQVLWRLQSTYTRIRNSPEINPDQAVGAATSVIGILFTIVSLLIVAFYWMTERATVKRLMLSQIPLRQRARAHEVWDEIEVRIGGWVRGQLLLMIIVGTASGVAYWFFELRFWLALAIWAGLTEAIPYIGPFIGGGTAVLVALTDSPEKAIWVLVFVIVLQQFEGAVLVPRIMKNAVGMNPLTVVLAVLIGNVLAGPLGSLLAIPIGAAIQVLIASLLRGQDSRLAAELSTMDLAPLSPAQFSSPFTPNANSLSRLKRSVQPASGLAPRTGIDDPDWRPTP